MATGFDSDYYNEPEPVATPETNFENEKPTAEAKDFAIESKSNMWENIKHEPEPEPVADDDEMDIPPSLRERLRGKKKK